MPTARWPGTPYGPVVEIGYPYELGPEFRYDQARYDTAGRYGPWWVWRRVECDVRPGSSIIRGSAAPSQRASSSTTSLSLSVYDTTLSPWWIDPATGQRPNRANLPLRVGVTHIADGTTRWLFTGWIDYITETDSVDELVVNVVASDGFKHLALLDQAEQAAQGTGEAAGARIGRILDRAAWQSTRDLSPGTFALQATTLAQPALEEIYLVADTEGGVVWIDTAGTFRFGDRDWLRAKASSAPWRIGDGQIDEQAVCASSIVTHADDMDIANVVGISRVGGTASWVEDTASIAKYGRHSWSRFDLPYASDADTPTILAFQLADRAARDYHIQAIVLSPLVEVDAWSISLQADLYDTVYVTRQRDETKLQEFAQVIGIDHSFGPAEFVTVLTLGPRIRQTNARYDVDVYDVARYSGT